MWILGKLVGIHGKVLGSARAEMWKIALWMTAIKWLLVLFCTDVGTLLVSVWFLRESGCSPCSFWSHLERNDAHLERNEVVGAFLYMLPPFSCLMHLSLGTGIGIFGMALGTGWSMTKNWEVGGISLFIHAQSDCGATESGAIWFLFQVAIKTRHWFIVRRVPQCLQCSSWLTRPEQIYPHQQSLYLAFTVVLLYSLRHPTLVSEDEQCCSAENQKAFCYYIQFI